MILPTWILCWWIGCRKICQNDCTGMNVINKKGKLITNKDRHYKLPAAKKYLTDADKTMGRLIELVGRTRVRSEQKLTIFQSLVRAIAYQMISTKAAAAIHSRLIEHCDSDLQPQKLLSLGHDHIREVGFSRAKTASLLELAEKFENGVLPDDEVLDDMSDQELTKCLTQVRGIGDWSVQMLMIFNLRRSDVFPASDLGVRRGHMLSYSLDEMLSAKELLAASVQWQPYRSVAAWYLWRANDCVDWEAVAASE